MKSFKIFAMAAFLAVAMSASAQTKTASSVGEGWSSVYVQWNPSSVDIKKDSYSITGLSLGYNQAFKILSDQPLYVEGGLAAQFSFRSEDTGQDSEVNMTMFSAKIPVNLTYMFNLPNSSVAIAPYVGLTLRANLFGSQKTTLGDKDMDNLKSHGYTDDDIDEYEESLNLFDDNDMGQDAVWKRFQLGWQIGANVFFASKYYAGISYGTDMSEIFKKAKISTTSITLGYCF